ncbi:MAG: hypothetical protein WDN69_32740 [Aliidongia sp.]
MPPPHRHLRGRRPAQPDRLSEDAQPGQVDPTVLHNLVLVYLPALVVLFLVAIGFVSAYRIDRRTHEANLRRLAEAAP